MTNFITKDAIDKINIFIQSYEDNKSNLHSNNQYKCLIQVRDYLAINNDYPSVILIDDIFVKDYVNFHDLKYILNSYCYAPKVVILPREGRTRFELYKGYLL